MQRMGPDSPSTECVEGQENLAFVDIMYDLRHRANIARRWSLGLPGRSKAMERKLGTMLMQYETLTTAIGLQLSEGPRALN
jgi:hypothetical protein